MDRNPGETARKMAEEALRRLAAELKAGRNDTLANYLSGMSRFRGQSWSNVLLIARQRPTATHVAGHHTWNELGRKVKTGEKGILVFVPVAGKQAYPFRTDGARATYVFDVSQTEGKPLPEPARTTGASIQHIESIRERIARRGIELKHGRSVAAAVAYVAARGLRLETPIFAAADGVLVRGDARALAQSLDVIQETSTQILDELLPDERTAARRTAASASSSNLLSKENFDKIHRDYGDRLIRSLTGFVGDRDRAEEIAARAFSTAWEKRDHFRGESQPSTWIGAIARNEARQSFVRDRIGRWDSLDDVNTRELPAPELLTEELEKHDDQRWLITTLAGLPAKQRRALTAHFIDGIPIREIARRDGVPLGTVLSRIFTGKQLLREALESSIPRGAVARDSRSLDPPRRNDLPPLDPARSSGAASVSRGR